MKTAIFVESDSRDKLDLLLKVAVEMGIAAEAGSPGVEEPAAAYNRSADHLKSAFIARFSSQHKLEVLLMLANELGIRLLPLAEGQAEDMLLAERSLKEEWLAPENDHWDEFLRSHKIE